MPWAPALASLASAVRAVVRTGYYSQTEYGGTVQWQTGSMAIALPKTLAPTQVR